MGAIGWEDLADLDVLVATSLIWFLAQFVRYVFPPLFGTFRETYGVSNTTLGLLFTALMLAYASMQFPSGAIADRVGNTRVIVAGAVVAAVGAFVAFGVRSFVALGLAVVLIGLGTGAHKTVAITLLSTVYPRRTGRLLGSLDAVGHLGGAAAPAAVVLVLAAGVGWEAVFLAIGAAGVGLALVFRSRMARRPTVGGPRAARDDGPKAPTSGDGLASYLRPFGDPHLATFVLVTVAYAVAWNGISAFLPLYLASETALSARGAALVYGSLFVAALVQPATGALADRFGRHGVMVGTLGLAGACLLLLLATSSPVVAFVIIPLMGVGGHGFRPVRDAYLVETIPPAVGGGTLGIARTAMIGTGAMAPAMVGFLSEALGFGIAFGVLAGALVVGTALVGGLGVASGWSSRR